MQNHVFSDQIKHIMLDYNSGVELHEGLNIIPMWANKAAQYIHVGVSLHTHHIGGFSSTAERLITLYPELLGVFRIPLGLVGRNISTIQNALNAMFADKACTKLNSTYQNMSASKLASDANYKALPAQLQNMVKKVQSGNWAESDTRYKTGIYP